MFVIGLFISLQVIQTISGLICKMSLMGVICPRISQLSNIEEIYIVLESFPLFKARIGFYCWWFFGDISNINSFLYPLSPFPDGDREAVECTHQSTVAILGTGAPATSSPSSGAC